MWQSMAGLGGNNESLKMPEILLIANPTVNPENRPKTKPELNATGGLIVDAVALPGTAQDAKKAASPSGDLAKAPAMTTVNLKAQASELSKQPGMAWLEDLTKRDDVDWKTVQLVHDNWDYKHSGLTPEGGIVVAIVVTILTWGIGSGAGASVAASTTTASGSAAVGAAAGAATTAAITTLASQAAVSLINNKGDVGKTLQDLSSDESIQQLLVSMLTAGITAGVSSALLPNPAASATGLTTPAFASRFTTYATQAMIGAGVKSLVYGQPLEEIAKTALAQSLTSEIGDWDKQYGLEPGSVTKIIAHAVVQCAAASVQGNDCGSAALGGAIAEALSPIAKDVDQSQLSQDLKLRGQLGNAIASMSTLLAATLTGSDVGTALGAAQMVDYYNRQLHPDQVAQAKRKASELAGKDGKSAAQWEKELTQQLQRQNDEAYASFPENAQARAILAELQIQSGISMSAEGTDAYNNQAINAQYITQLKDSYYKAGLPANLVKIDPVVKALADATQVQDFLSQDKSVQRSIYDQLIGAYRTLPSDADAVKMLASGQISPESYAFITQSRSFLQNSLYRSGPLFLQAGILTPEEQAKFQLQNRVAVAQALAATTIGVMAGKGLASAEKITASKASDAEFRALVDTPAPTVKPDGRFETVGLNRSPLDFPDGVKMVIELENAGLSRSEAIIRARDFISSGTTPPVATPLDFTDKLVKVVPAGGQPSTGTGYWLREKELLALQKDPAGMANKLGLPPGMQVDKYDVYQITPRQNAVAFESTIAPTKVDGVANTTGGAKQTIVVDRNRFTPPIKVGSIDAKKGS